MEVLRVELLRIKGIGRETADSILLYAGRKLTFVSDAYTKRLMVRYGLMNECDDYEEIRRYFMDNLEEDVYIYNEFHALIVHHGYLACRTKPVCDRCPIRSIGRDIKCRYFQKQPVSRK